MYRLMIVEDEEIEREYLRRFVNWKSMGIEVVAAFESGEEALEYAELSDIQMLLTDIKLIGISGLQLSKKLLALKPGVKIVILTGYQQFEYAKEAVDLQAFSFLTKPVVMEELEAVFNKIVKRLELEESEKLDKERLQQIVAQNMPVLKNKFFDDLINGRLTTPEIAKNLVYFDLEMPSGSFNLLVSEIDSFGDMKEGMYSSDVHLMQIKVLEILKAIKAPPLSVTFHVKDGRYCTLVATDSPDADLLYAECLDLAQRIQDKVNFQLQMEMTIGIGKGVRDLSDLKVSYKNACDAVAFKFYMGSNQIIHYKDVYYDEKSSGIDMDEIGRHIATAVGLCDRENMEESLSMLFEDLRRNACTDTYIRNICINVLSRVSATMQDIHESFGKVFGNEALVWEKLLRMDTVFDLKLWIKNILNAVVDYLNEKKTGCNKRIITTILNFIEANYHKNITIGDIASHVYLSPNYISVIFKKETGEAFTNYMIRYRMEKAAQMLKDSNLKVYEVGDKVGYTNTSHFCTAFKKMYGVSPNEYRERI